jgi:phosphotransacetylase/acyl dehydratase
MMQPKLLRNRPFAQIHVGDSAQLSRTLTRLDVKTFALVSGDLNPTHVDDAFVAAHGDAGLVAHNIWAGALISSVLGNELPGPGTVYLAQTLSFERPVRVGDTVTASVTVTEKHDASLTVVLSCRCTNQMGHVVASGAARVRAPEFSIEIARPDVGEMAVQLHDKFEPLLQAARAIRGAPTAVAYPCSEGALESVVEAAEQGLIEPILVGPQGKLLALAARMQLDIARFRLVDMPDGPSAAAAAVALVRAGEAQLLMKGSLHTDELLSAVVRRETGLRTSSRLSHVFVMDVPTYHKLLLVTDAAINIFPTLEEKRDICQNAIGLAQALGVKLPKVAVLSAVEGINPKMPSTTDAASLCKMADRGQITGALIDGPLAMDNAISAEAARTKGIRSAVAGDPDILLAPDLEAGNILAKQLTFMAQADAAGIVLGARVPIILTSRADSVRARLASCALGVVMAQALRAAQSGDAA